MEINLPYETEWAIERSHLVASHGEAIPEGITIKGGILALERKVQYLADGKCVNDNRPPIGLVYFRYEVADGKILMVHCYFLNKHDKLTRFMRLRRI